MNLSRILLVLEWHQYGNIYRTVILTSREKALQVLAILALSEKHFMISCIALTMPAMQDTNEGE